MSRISILGFEMVSPKNRLRVVLHRCSPRLRVSRVVDEGHLDAELRQRVLEQVERAAIERRRRDDVVAGLGDVEDREGLGGLPGRDEEGTDATFERGDALLDGVLRRVHDARVDVAELLEREQVCRVLGVLEDVGGRLVDRQCACTCRRVGLLPGMDLTGLEGPVRGAGSGVVGHGLAPCVCRACGTSVDVAPGLHPGHPTAVGGLPASEPGLVAGTHDLVPTVAARDRHTTSASRKVDHPVVTLGAGRMDA